LPIPEDSFIKAIEKMFDRKGERVVALNLEAFQKGKALAQYYTEV